MSEQYHSSYYAERAAKEREMAEHAATPAIRNVHLEMAERYELIVAGMQPEQAPIRRTA